VDVAAVFAHVAASLEAQAAYVAFCRTQARVDSLVDAQHAHVPERLLTMSTFVWALT
jgi:hypothetical protein